jgi:Xaa-Pro aminopeptidase
VSLDTGGRVERLAAQLRERELDALLLTAPVNVRYLTGFTGSNALVLIAADGPGAGIRGGVAAHRFFTDFRYATQSADQVSERFAREIVLSGKLLEAAAEALKAIGREGARLGFDEQSTTVAQHSRLRELLSEAWELVACGGVLERLRAVKDAAEIARIRAACGLADEALLSVLERGLAGRTEREVAIDLELQVRRLGADPSFPSIVAAGAHGALPHAEPREEPIPPDALVTIDWGALHEGYCSDCTRTYATGERLPPPAREVYELVRTAQARALAAVRAGPSGVELDALAREVIEAAGHGEHFGHGLGHGVGLEVHEAPRLSRTAGEDPLLEGNVVTIEPGVYLPGELGVRIEDLVVVRADGPETLTGLPTELTVVS